jgi:hypothetical protein
MNQQSRNVIVDEALTLWGGLVPSRRPGDLAFSTTEDPEAQALDFRETCTGVTGGHKGLGYKWVSRAVTEKGGAENKPNRTNLLIINKIA